jgi:hypothetical protein
MIYAGAHYCCKKIIHNLFLHLKLRTVLIWTYMQLWIAGKLDIQWYYLTTQDASFTEIIKTKSSIVNLLLLKKYSLWLDKYLQSYTDAKLNNWSFMFLELLINMCSTHLTRTFGEWKDCCLRHFTEIDESLNGEV